MKLGIGIVFLMVIITSLTGSFGADQPGSQPTSINATAVPDHVTLSWVGDPMTTQTVTWRTDTTVGTGIVQYGTSKELKENMTKSANVSILKTDLGNENISTTTLTNLKPGTQYYYRVGSGKNNWSPVYSFNIENNNTNQFKFLVFGDSQSGDAKKPDYKPWQSTVQNASKANPDASFFVNVGDAVEVGQSNAHWNNWFAADRGVIDSISYMPVEGNHETYDLNNNKTVPTLYEGQFNVPNNGPYNNSEAYSYDYGNVHFVVLDSQFLESQKFHPNLMNDEKAWLEKDLSQTKKDWKVVFWHKTPYYTKPYRTYEDIKAAFGPVLDKYHADVVFNGHDHCYSRTYPINNDTIVGSPALGTVYVITGRSGAKYYNDNVPKVWDVNFFDAQDMPNYMVVDVNGSKMEIKNFKMDGTLVDDYTMDKTNGGMPETAVPPKYNKPRLVVNGAFLNQPLMPTFPSQINSKWYFPIKPAVEFLGGSESVSGNNETLSLVVQDYTGSGIVWSDGKVHVVVLTNASTKAMLDKTPITLPDSVSRDSSKNFLITGNDMNTLFGFTWKYDPHWNILFLTNPNTNN